MVNYKRLDNTHEFPSRFFTPKKEKHMKKLLALALVITCNTPIKAGWDAEGLDVNESLKLRLKFAAEQQAKEEAATQEYLPIAQALKQALESKEVNNALQTFKQQIIAGFQNIAKTIETQLTVSPEHTAKLKDILTAALNVANRIKEVGSDLTDAQTAQLQNTLSMKLQPLLLAIDKTFEIQKTFMSAAIQGKAPIDEEKIKAGAEQVAAMIQEIINNLKAKTETKEKK